MTAQDVRNISELLKDLMDLLTTMAFKIREQEQRLIAIENGQRDAKTPR